MSASSESERTLSKGRVGYVDIAKFLAILAVIYDHAQYYYPGLQHSNSYILLRVFVFSFYLQAFFFVTGIVDRENHGEPESWGKFLQKQFFSILIPYVAWAAILSASWNGSFVKGLLWGTQTSLSAGTDSILWFLPVLFWARIIYRGCMQAMYRVLGKESPVVLIAGALILGFAGWMLSGNGSNKVIWGLDIALMSAALMLLGRCLKPAMERLRSAALKWKLLTALVSLVLAVALAYANVPMTQDAAGILVFRKAVWMAHGYFGLHWLLFLASSTVSCVFVLTVAMLLEGSELLIRLGQNTLGFMLVHGRLYPLAVALIRPLLGGLPAVCSGVLLAGVNGILCIPVVWFINRFAPALLGKRAPKPKTEG